LAAIGDITAKKEKLAIGLMSGTSCDGLDIALIRINGFGRNTRFQLIAASSYAYDSELQNFLRRFPHNPDSHPQAVSQLNFYLAFRWAEMLDCFLNENKFKNTEIDFIGSHGHTVWHQPQPQPFLGREVCSTLQLGDPSALANLSGIPVAGDFRVADVSLGGQGAPLIPFFDWIYFSSMNKNIVAVNIGGISNLTFIPANGDFLTVTAFDCGPGNMLIDLAARHYFRQPFDADGSAASSGKFNTAFFDFLCDSDLFITSLPPKSCGREQYGSPFFEKIISASNRLQLSAQDVLHTLTAYTAHAIFENYSLFISGLQKADLIAVGGGGAGNKFLMHLLQEKFQPVKVLPLSHLGLDENFKEAIGFAVLANETFHGQPSNLPQVTGARRPAVLGKICLP